MDWAYWQFWIQAEKLGGSDREVAEFSKHDLIFVIRIRKTISKSVCVSIIILNSRLWETFIVPFWNGHKITKKFCALSHLPLIFTVLVQHRSCVIYGELQCKWNVCFLIITVVSFELISEVRTCTGHPYLSKWTPFKLVTIDYVALVKTSCLCN